MKKVFDQTVRDLKREVNKKVLKIPGIEQKILDATSNEPWGPHGTVLADIAQATRSYHEYQIIMRVIWKRINGTRKNWRHVYKGLSVLEYLVAHGSERVIDEIREHAHQISTSSDFQYIDSSGMDQGSNVRRKSQSLIALVNDAERIREVRQKANANKERYCDMVSTGGMHCPTPYSGSGGYGDRNDDEHYNVHYGNRDDERNEYGRDRHPRDVDRYGRGDSNNQGANDRDRSRDADYKGSRGNDGHDFGTRSGNIDGDRARSIDEHHLQASRQLECKYLDNGLGAPPSYEEATGEHKKHAQDERDVVAAHSPPLEASSPPSPKASAPEGVSHGQTLPEFGETMSHTNKQIGVLDEFDPRDSSAATAPVGTSPEMDIFGLSTVDSISPLALMTVTADATSDPCIPNNLDVGAKLDTLSSASSVFNQIAADPFGDSPFKAIQDNNSFSQQQNLPSVTSFQLQTSSMSELEAPQPVAQMMQSIASFDFGEAFHSTTSTTISDQGSSMSPQFLPLELAAPAPDTVAPGGMHPQVGITTATCSHVFQHGISATAELTQANILYQPATSASPAYPVGSLPQTGFSASMPLQAPLYPLAQWGSATALPVSQLFPVNHHSQPGQSTSLVTQADPLNPFAELGPSDSSPSQLVSLPMHSQPGHSAPLVSQAAPSTILSQPGLSASGASQPNPPATTGPPAKSTQQDDKFEMKSTVWADTLNRGLVNLNISGPKINPLSDIGIDFDSINRMEKRKEKEKNSIPQVSTITMGKAMGAGSGIGRVGASGLAPPPNPMMGAGMGMGMSMGNGGISMGMGGGYGGGMNQPMGMGMNVGMGMGVNLGVGQGAPMQPPAGIGLPPGQPMPGFGYNPMMGNGGPGGYGPQQQYGGYR